MHILQLPYYFDVVPNPFFFLKVIFTFEFETRKSLFSAPYFQDIFAAS